MTIHFKKVAKQRYIKLRSNFIKRSAGAAGFTLLEVMVSLAIISTAFAAVLSLHSDSMELVINSRARTKAAELAQYKMTEIEITGLDKISVFRFSHYQFRMQCDLDYPLLRRIQFPCRAVG